MSHEELEERKVKALENIARHLGELVKQRRELVKQRRRELMARQPIRLRSWERLQREEEPDI